MGLLVAIVLLSNVFIWTSQSFYGNDLLGSYSMVRAAYGDPGPEDTLTLEDIPGLGEIPEKYKQAVTLVDSTFIHSPGLWDLKVAEGFSNNACFPAAVPPPATIDAFCAPGALTQLFEIDVGVSTNPIFTVNGIDVVGGEINPPERLGGLNDILVPAIGVGPNTSTAAYQTNPGTVRVDQTVVTFPDLTFSTWVFKVTNVGAAPIADLKFGFYSDWDINFLIGFDTTVYDPATDVASICKQAPLPPGLFGCAGIAGGDRFSDNHHLATFGASGDASFGLGAGGGPNNLNGPLGLDPLGFGGCNVDPKAALTNPCDMTTTLAWDLGAFAPGDMDTLCVVAGVAADLAALKAGAAAAAARCPTPEGGLIDPDADISTETAITTEVTVEEVTAGEEITLNFDTEDPATEPFAVETEEIIIPIAEDVAGETGNLEITTSVELPEELNDASPTAAVLIDVDQVDPDTGEILDDPEVDLSDPDSFAEPITFKFLLDADFALGQIQRHLDGCPVAEVFVLNESGPGLPFWELVGSSIDGTGTVIRDPSTDVVDPNTAEILQCEYCAFLPHLSKFSVGGVKRPTSPGGGGGPNHSFIDEVGPRIIDYYWKPDLPLGGEDVTINANIQDDVVVNSAVVFAYSNDQAARDAEAFTMENQHGLWYTTVVPGSLVDNPKLFFWIVAIDQNGNSARTDEIPIDVEQGGPSTSSRTKEGEMTARGVGSNPKAPEKVELLEVSSLGSGDQISSYTDTIVIRNVGSETVDNVRLVLSSGIPGSFMLSDYAIKKIEPESEVKVSFKHVGRAPNRDASGGLVSYNGNVIVAAGNGAPIYLPVNIGIDSPYHWGDYMQKVSALAQQRYSKVWMVNSLVSKATEEYKPSYEVSTSSSENVISSASDELLIKNISEKELKNMRLYLHNKGQAFLMEHNVIQHLAPNGEMTIKLIPQFSAAKGLLNDIKGELLIVPSNDIPIQIPVNIVAEERISSADAYEVSTNSETNVITTAADEVRIKNDSGRTMDSVQVLLTNDLSRVFSLDKVAIQQIEDGDEVTVELRPATPSLRTFMQDYVGELVVASEHHNPKNVQISIEWKEVSSEHFSVYIRSADEALAEQVTDLLEKSYGDITARLGEPNTKTVIYMATNLEEMELISPSGHPYYSYSDDAILICSCADPEYNAMKQFVYRLVIKNHANYSNLQKFVVDQENWLLDGISSYIAASSLGADSEVSQRHLDAFVSSGDEAAFQWYRNGEMQEYGATHIFFKFLEDKYGSSVVEKSVEYLRSGMTTHERCSTVEECAIVRAAHDILGIDMDSTRNKVMFASLVEEWKEFIDVDSLSLNTFQKAELEKALSNLDADLPLTGCERGVLELAKSLKGWL